ncbi:hypothetical protein ACWCOW_26790 [Streptomyces sp. NPDC001939]
MRNNVDDCVMCEAPGCRHVRTGFKKCVGSRDLHIRIPEPD